MYLYKSATEIEIAGICHRNSVKSWVETGKIIEFYSHHKYKKGHKFLGYALREELLKEMLA